MAKKDKKTSADDKKILESSEALAEQLSKGEQFIEQNKKLIFIVGGIVMAVFAGIFGYNYYTDNQNEQAQIEIFQAQYYFERDSLDKALLGDGNNYGFLDVIEEYPLTDASNLAHFYAGAIYLKKGEYESAIEYLEGFSSSDLVVPARAYSLIGDAYMEQGLYNDAAEQYMKAGNYNTNEFTSPDYFIKAAIAYEKMDDLEMAKKMYEEIKKISKKGTEYYQIAIKHEARLNGIMKKTTE